MNSSLKSSFFLRSVRMAKSFAAFACWIIPFPTQRTLCQLKLSFRRSRSAVAPISTFPLSATPIKCRLRAGSSAWCLPLSKLTTPKTRLSLASTCSAQSHRSSSRSRTITSRPTTAWNRKSSSRSRTTRPRISKQRAWMCWTSSREELARTLTSQRLSRNWATRSSKVKTDQCLFFILLQCIQIC
jgi:hypothetical protein